MPTYPAVTAPANIQQGTFAARPASGRFLGDTYLVTSGAGTGLIYIWNGGSWQSLSQAFRQTNLNLTAGGGVIQNIFGAPGEGSHLAIMAGAVNTAGATTGGALSLGYTANGVAQSLALDPGTHGAGGTFPFAPATVYVDANTNLTINQTALSAGAAILLGYIALL